MPDNEIEEPDWIYDHPKKRTCRWFGSKRCAVNDPDADCDRCIIYETEDKQ